MLWRLDFYPYRQHFWRPKAPPPFLHKCNKFINIQYCYWIGSWTELLDGREQISEFQILQKSRIQFPVSGPSEITQTRVMASNAIRCSHTHTIPKNRSDSNFCRDMLGQDVGWFFIARFKFLSCGNHTKNRIIWTIRFNIICRDEWGDFTAWISHIVWTSTKGEFDAIIKKVSFWFKENFTELFQKFLPIFENILLYF